MKHRISFLFVFIYMFFLSQVYATIYVVNSTGDGPDVAWGDGICADASGACTLRAAMEEANFSIGTADIIQFNILPAGLHTIFPLSQLPLLIDQAGTTIDGLTQPGGAFCDGNVPNHNLLIEIDGANAGPPPVHGIWIGSDNNAIKGLVINNFSGDGVRIEGGAGGFLAWPHADRNVITCNIIGTDVGGGLAKPNGTIPGIIYAGITIKNIRVQETYTTALNNIVDANLVSGNIVEGVQIIGPVQPGDVGFNQVLNNFIGTDLSGMQPIPNHREGVNLTEGTHDNQVFGNLISANLWDGIGIQGFSNIGFLQGPIFTSRNIIRDNRIGIDNTPSPNPPGALGNGNHGIAIGIYGPNGLWGYADSNQVVNNTSWFNSAAGIALWEDKASADPPDFAFPFANTDMNYLSQNSIWSNGGLGIDIEIDGVTLNDGPADPDMAANQQLNFPYSMTVAIGGTSEMVSGIVDPGAINVEVYLTNPDPSGYGEGKTYLGSATPNAAGQWSLTTFGKINTASFVTAIAHDGLGNTSEFGQNVSPPLAIDLLSFSVAAKKKSIQLNWQVPLNLHVAKFCVQRALIDEPFKEIEVLPGNEFTRKYTFTFEDFNVRGGVDYMYRIGLERMDGTFYYTSIEMARIDNLIKHVFPNPTRQNIVNVNIGNCVSGELQLISSTGGVLRTVILNEQEEIQLDIKSLIPGIYSIRFINNQSLWAERLVVL